MQTHSADAPWITPRIKRLIGHRNKAFYTNTLLYKTLRYKVIQEIKKVKANHYTSKLHNLKQTNIQN
ncbi:hypothetical protein E2C01_082156 [Portunus trituberculatus]|uniref:Uncharacterized protein n=1 Tax=Portunus trituberculatus TaxID=210409 RepID=A0A5B7J2Z9_PORTR|nr:hypothetical protein [Portunus trituberculatus]